MSKHSSPEEKLKVAKQLRDAIAARQASTMSKSQPSGQSAPQVPPKGTNDNNQYR